MPRPVKKRSTARDASSGEAEPISTPTKRSGRLIMLDSSHQMPPVALTTAGEPAKAESNEARPKIAMLASKSGLRPNRSPIGPEDKAPTRMPMLDQTNAVVNAGPGRFQAWVSDGTATPIELMS